MPGSTPVAAIVCLNEGSFMDICCQSAVKLAAKTPVRLPAMASREMPPDSKASYTTSHSFRCCGSIHIASTGVMLKRPGSKFSRSSLMK
ncbi:hypothetical protein CGRA01v4_07646 [Colletotrichum graminicola]|nr:hypothetical protein CGRA01v4_07646 [Colletotrichum graminicola]